MSLLDLISQHKEIAAAITMLTSLAVLFRRAIISMLAATTERDIAERRVHRLQAALNEADGITNRTRVELAECHKMLAKTAGRSRAGNDS